MAFWTLGQVMSEATAIIGGRADIAASRASLYANQAAIDIQIAVEPLDLEGIATSSTTSGENRIALPTDFYDVLALYNTSITPPQPITKWNYYDVDSAQTALGAPTNYLSYSSYLQLWPSPDSSYSLQLRYQVRPSVMTNLTAIPSFDTRFGMCWLYRTAEYLADSVKDYETALMMRNKFLSTLATIPSDLALRQRDRNGQNIRFGTRPTRERFLNFDDSVGFPPSLYGP
jgi:hypothetical protein